MMLVDPSPSTSSIAAPTTTATASATCPPPATLPTLLRSVTQATASTSTATATSTPPPPSAAPAPPPTVPKRADLLSLKLKLADLLPPHLGQLYWTSLVEFMSGQINRDELQGVFERVFGKGKPGEHDTALQLHNALLLSILYNTTRIAVPPSTLRHSGFQVKRRLGAPNDPPNNGSTSDVDPLRKKLKTLVMSLGKRERREIKALVPTQTGVTGTAASTTSAAALLQQQDQAQLQAIKEAGGVVPSALAKRESERERERKRDKELVRLSTLGAALESGKRRGEVDAIGGGTGGKTDPAITQEYQRIIASSSAKDSLLCSTSKLLPDVDGLRDRMTLVVFESGLVGGGVVDERVGLLGVRAVETHLKNIIAHVVGLVRSDRDRGIRTSSITKEQLSIFDAARPVRREVREDDPPAGEGDVKAEQSFDPVKAVRLLDPPLEHDHVDEEDEDEEQRPLTTDDFLGLFDINPSVLVVPRLGAVERSYALPPDSDDSDMTEGDDEAEDAAIEADDEAMVVDEPEATTAPPTTMPKFPERPRLGGKSHPKLAPVRSTSSSSSTTLAGTSSLSRSKHPLSRSGSTSRRPSTISRSRSHRPSRSNSFSTNALTPGGGPRDQYLIDPSAVAIPQGDFVNEWGQSFEWIEGELDGRYTDDGEWSDEQTLGDIDLDRDHQHSKHCRRGRRRRPNLTQELGPSASTLPRIVDRVAFVGGVRRWVVRGATDGTHASHLPGSHALTKIGGLQAGGVGSSMGPAGAAGGPGKKNKEQLWQVVDSVRLLDGVL
ncbi:BZ3500_MvSof-1268-A1-R1_Chr1-1g01218 [Microbotryum saponariae]|uniref:BZ3500_MvSof-1268-A1-R1_Chr1-1g01218 protein n=1 Tax=Microbotryum saponariae TaxID=289078 RepID=A0A2X0KFI7_9BASI|nr:BZ3500_MvSof-1268-A1-R1_Chr1-1g01218 [Microbotryum saponariae]SCZ93702.1 BZ3501_MvSof-1269-A2-R1_Chr1-1g00814 [Microbotryum saponariae]